MLQKIQKLISGRSPKERTGIYFAIFFVVIALMDRVVLQPITAKIAELDSSIEEQEKLIQRSSRVLSQQDVMEKEIAQYDHLLVESLSEEEEIALFLKEVGALASKSSVYVVDMKFRGVISGEETARYVVNMNCEAQMSQIVKFMYQLGKSRNLLKIAAYNMVPKSKESSIVKANLSIHKLRTQTEELSS